MSKLNMIIEQFALKLYGTSDLSKLSPRQLEHVTSKAMCRPNISFSKSSVRTVRG